MNLLFEVMFYGTEEPTRLVVNVPHPENLDNDKAEQYACDWIDDYMPLSYQSVAVVGRVEVFKTQRG